MYYILHILTMDDDLNKYYICKIDKDAPKELSKKPDLKRTNYLN